MKKLLISLFLGIFCAFEGTAQTTPNKPDVLIHAVGCFSLAGVGGTVSVKTTSPAQKDLHSLKYCLCSSSGEVVATYPNPVGEETVRLRVDLPVGNYTLRTTNGTYFYGAVPYTVWPCEPCEAHPAHPLHEPHASKPSGFSRFWTDYLAFNRTHLNARQSRPSQAPEPTIDRRLVSLLVREPNFHSHLGTAEFPTDSLRMLIHHTIAHMKRIGANVLICSVTETPKQIPDFLSAWYTKFDAENLSFIPLLACPQKAKEHVDELLEQGVPHPSFKGLACVCSSTQSTRQTHAWDESTRRKIHAQRADLLYLNLPERTSSQTAHSGGIDFACLTKELGVQDVRRISIEGELLAHEESEACLVPFAHAFRALPPCVMPDLSTAYCPKGVLLRGKTWNDQAYFYLLNTSDQPVTHTLDWPRRTKDLVTGETWGGFWGYEKRSLTLKPYELRAFVSPSDFPRIDFD